MKNKLMIIAGPTAVGKTNISIQCAKRLNAEIISADSMQIYKYMDIGSAKISSEEMEGIPHHLIDLLDPKDEYSVAQFKTDAENAIAEITSKNKLPIIAGGTGLYINSLIYNYDFAQSNKDEVYREYLSKQAEEKGKEFVHEMLKEVDYSSYERLFPNDLKRVIRALEIYKVTGKKISEYYENQNTFDIPYDLKYYVLTMNREALYDRINKRVDLMLEKGLVEEVTALKQRGYTKDLQSMKGIGYKEILQYLDGEVSLEDAIEKIKQGSRNYAKRQLTWFRKDPRAVWIDKDNFKSEKEIVDFICEDMK